MAVLPILDNWSGDMRNGDDGFFWQQNRITASHSGFSISHLSRIHAEYRMSNQVAWGFYYEANDLEPEELYEVNADIKAHHYEGEGIRLAYSWNGELAQGHWALKPTFSSLNIHTLYWGDLEGYVYYGGPGDWGGDADFSYGYTDDKVGRGTLPQRSYGRLKSLGLEAEFRADKWQIQYRGENLWARLNWHDSLYSNGYWSTTR
ncbi:MAG: hypothetical protein ACPGYX_03765, partial [Oceanobacter sp.]